MRDDFTEASKRTLAIRAAYFCSNPACLKLTAGPHSDENKSLTNGHAAHIHAAAAGGPRYAAHQTRDLRRSVANGIWLCRECGDLVDKDALRFPASLLKRWKSNHEKMIAEVRTKGYAKSVDLIRSHYNKCRLDDPILAKSVLALFEDRRALWTVFDAEFPDRVRQSLDRLRSDLTDLRRRLPDDEPMDQIVLSLTKTIHIFFDQVESIDLVSLRCDSGDRNWNFFRDSLAELRKSIGYQIWNLARAYNIRLSQDLNLIAPVVS